MCQQHKPQLALEQVLVLGIVMQVTGHRGATDPPAISLHIVAAAAQFGNWPLVPASTSAAGASMHGAGAGAVGAVAGGTGVGHASQVTGHIILPIDEWVGLVQNANNALQLEKPPPEASATPAACTSVHCPSRAGARVGGWVLEGVLLVGHALQVTGHSN